MSTESIMWDGNPCPEVLTPGYREARNHLADCARHSDWQAVLKILHDKPEWVNATRPGGQSLYTPLHHAAYSGAPVQVVKQLISLGAWRTIKNQDGKRAIDVARDQNHFYLIDLLEPVYRQEIPLDTLQKIQNNFHAVIRGRIGGYEEKYKLWLPELIPLLEYPLRFSFFFEVPNMYGGFHYWLEKRWYSTLLISNSFCRVVAGSEEYHIITPYGSVLALEGF